MEPAATTEEETSPTLSSSASLDEYRLYAVGNNPKLKALYHQWRAQMERAPQVRALPEPRVSYSEFLREVEHTPTRVDEEEVEMGQVEDPVSARRAADGDRERGDKPGRGVRRRGSRVV